MQDIIHILNLGPDQEARSLNPSFPSDAIKRGREERVLSIVKQSKEQGFAVRFHEGEIDRANFIDGRVGINRSFKRIVKWAKQNNLPRVIMGEDDLLFSAPGAWQYYLENLPDDYDLWMGVIYAGEIREGRVMNGFSGGMTLITVHERFYDFFLGIDPQNHIDRALGNFCFEKKYLACAPFVCRQMSKGFSDNLNKPVCHDAYLEGMKFFGD